MARVADPLLTAEDVAAQLGVTTITVYRWNTAGIGPLAVRLGHPNRPVLRYRQAEVDRWVLAREDRKRRAS